MAWNPIGATVPQYSASDNTLASGYYLRFEASGTTTDINMATDSGGGTQLTKCAINDAGYPITGASAVFIPHVNEAYKISLYPTETDADNKTNAVWSIDGLYPINELTLAEINADNVNYTSPERGLLLLISARY